MNRAERNHLICERHLAGQTCAEIGRAFGLTTARIAQVVAEHGLDRSVRLRAIRAQRKRDSGPLANRWNGGKTHTHGYIKILQPDHLRADSKGYVLEHIVIAERVLGKPLPAQAEMHHADTNRQNNKNDNLVICQDSAYHALLHVRMEALDATGNPNLRRCMICREYDNPAAMYHRRGVYRHRHCHAQRERERNRKVQAVQQFAALPRRRA